MTHIGDPLRELEVEPVIDPVPHESPVPLPEPEREKVEVGPERERETVGV